MKRHVHLPIATGAQLGRRGPVPEAGAALTDSLGRPLRDLRVSVTDRCNFRCSYCMPKEVFGPSFEFLPKPDILSFEEVTRAARAFAALGVQKLRLTGGEPLLRSQLHLLVAQLAQLDLDLALTTNASLLDRHAQRLKDAGLRRVTVSLDALTDATFRRMNDVDFPVAKVLAGIDAARAAGLRIKVNCVVKRGVNDDQIVPLAEHFRGSGVVLRFIEYMDVGSTNAWQADQVFSGDQIIARIDERFPVKELPRDNPADVAARFGYRDGAGEVGVITSVTQPFCGHCSRARLSASGKLYTCLFASDGFDLRGALRQYPDDAKLRDLICDIWSQRSDRYSELRGQAGAPRTKVEMSHIGG